jgi:DNA/RNA-binding domain of Phe-tRNA-synthetase-like protein
MDVARAEDVMVQMNGAVKALRAGDMVMRDSGQVVCTVIYGQDNISPISNATTHALYVAYAPLDVQEQQVESQLRKIEENIRLFCPNATTEQLMIIHSSQG